MNALRAYHVADPLDYVSLFAKPALAYFVFGEVEATLLRTGLISYFPAAPLAMMSESGDVRSVRCVVEVWADDAPVRRCEMDGVRIATSEHHAHVFLKDHPTDEGLARATRRAYGRLLTALRNLEYPHLVRMWNFIPQINGMDPAAGHMKLAHRERYRQFCVGRSDAFADFEMGSFPSASSIGVDGQAAFFHCIAARHPVLALENPRQISAYLYPEIYGPRSPLFARGVLCACPGGSSLVVSGTAAVVNHRSVHLENVAEQTREALINLREILRHSEGGSPLFRVYLRRPDDLPLVAAVIRESWDQPVSCLFVHGELCRQELLIEIEAVAGPH